MHPAPDPYHNIANMLLEQYVFKLCSFLHYSNLLMIQDRNGPGAYLTFKHSSRVLMHVMVPDQEHMAKMSKMIIL